jgi:transcription antitermination factor NusG
MDSGTVPWVVLIVRPRTERKVELGLRNVGVETFVAWHGVPRRWSDRVKVLHENLFTGCVFCRSTFADRIMVKGQPGVRSLVRFNGKPAMIADEQIALVRRLLESGLPLGPWPFLESGERVRIEQGVLAGVEGKLADGRVVVGVEAIQMSIAVRVGLDQIFPRPQY